MKNEIISENLNIERNKKIFSINDLHNILKYLNNYYYKIEDELAKPYEDKNENLPDDFFHKAYDEAVIRAIKNLRE
jgi:hypothetical protein